MSERAVPFDRARLVLGAMLAERFGVIHVRERGEASLSTEVALTAEGIGMFREQGVDPNDPGERARLCREFLAVLEDETRARKALGGVPLPPGLTLEEVATEVGLILLATPDDPETV